MKILNTEQIHHVDTKTMEYDGISSLELMEKAAVALTESIRRVISMEDSIIIFAGRGNNGGDALAVGRLLYHKGYDVTFVLIKDKSKLSQDLSKNIERIPNEDENPLLIIESKDDIPALDDYGVVIDGLFGTGIKGALPFLMTEVIQRINEFQGLIIAIDIPSGIPVDGYRNDIAVKADVTFTLEVPKASFFYKENDPYVGDWEVIPFGLNKRALKEADTDIFLIDVDLICNIYAPRHRHSHKGKLGKVILMAGGRGKMGAAILAGRAVMRTGAGLLTIHSPKCGYQILQISFPEAMIDIDLNEYYIGAKPTDLQKYDVVAMGPGIGTHGKTADLLREVLMEVEDPVVMDADALNILSRNEDLWKYIPENSILTPHRIEFERLSGASGNDKSVFKAAREFAKKHKIVLVLKGAYTAIATPKGEIYFNNTGNPGMATGGSGDVLTGMIASLLAQRYTPVKAAVFGVYLHGLAGDLAAMENGEEFIIASDIICSIGKAYLNISDQH